MVVFGLCAACVLPGLAGCENAGQGAVSGAGIGALSGLAIGSLSGDAGKGAAIGAVVGGLGGAVVGDQNRRRSEAGGAGSTDAQRSASPAQLTQTDRDRLALGKLARAWKLTGWETVEGHKRFLSGTAVGSVENSYFLRLNVNVTEDQTGRASHGNILFASEPGRGLTMTSRFDTSPSALAYAGTVSNNGDVFTLRESGRGNRQIVIRFLSADQWVADVSDPDGSGRVPRGSLTFSASN